MFKKILLIIPLLLASCISVDADSGTPLTAGPAFVTSTLPPTKQAYVPATMTATPEVVFSPTAAVTAPPNCSDRAVLLRDVTIQDNTQVRPGETFTKTWEFQNVGDCPWINYKLVFAAGDQMGAPLSAPIPTTLSNEKAEVSVELTAPAASGTYTGYFTLHNANDKIVPIGAEQTFWVKIIVGGTNAAAPAASPTQRESGSAGGGRSAHCNYAQNAGYVNQTASLINAERAKAGLPALTINSQLAALAQAHAADMACNDKISHSGSDGSTPASRAAAAGYAGSFTEEIIYGGGGPEAAVTWWMNDKIHRDAILKEKTTEMGVGYAYFSNGSYGDFIVVEFGSQ
ncbi:MAG: CAP domain-containing protein [Chloroflexi bacterium]|nr:CAP domain-containing protein [Chloroflexota bacterium]